MKKVIINGIVCEYETQEELKDIVAVMGVSAPAQAPAKVETKAKAPRKGKGASAPKSDEVKLRLSHEESLKLMVDSWHNRAAAAYDRRVNHGTGAVKYADIDARKLTKADIEAGKKSLLASKKWASACKNHGLTEDMLKF